MLVIGGPGAAIFATGGFDGSPNVGALGVALAFDLSLMTMAYLIGRISGCHINPAVTIGMIVTRKLDAAKSAPYFVGQFVGGIVGAGILALILSGTDGYFSPAQDAGFASNGFGPIAASFGLALVHIIAIPVSGKSVNPARSLATAVFQGDWALGQVWAFIVSPAIGAALAGVVYLVLSPQVAAETLDTESTAEI